MNYDKEIDEFVSDFISHYGHQDCTHICPAFRAKQALTELVAKMELYGRLHETIEAFQKGQIGAGYYSKRHEDITAALSSNKQGGK